MKKIVIEVSDELYERYKGENLKEIDEELTKTDLAFLADAFVNGVLVEDYKGKTSFPVYVVTADGYRCSYGSEVFLIGVFTDKEAAEKAAKRNNGMVTEVGTNKEFTLRKRAGDYGNMTNRFYLGGYTE